MNILREENLLKNVRKRRMEGKCKRERRSIWMTDDIREINLYDALKRTCPSAERY